MTMNTLKKNNADLQPSEALPQGAVSSWCSRGGCLKHIGLFDGIGGFSLAARWAGWKTVAWVEWNDYCQKVLRKNFPEAEGYGDIKQTDFTKYENKIDIITGGFPCQPFSVAGKQKGKDDERYLWDEMLRAIKEIKPPFIVGENVTGIINMALGEVLTTLENEGYEVETFIIPACAINAPHKRDRVWIVAYSERIGRERGFGWGGEIQTAPGSGATIASAGLHKASTNTNSQHRQEFKRRDKLGYEGKETTLGRSIYETMWDRNWLEVASELCRVDDGLPKELDKSKRISALGNAIVPQIAYEIFMSMNVLAVAPF